VEFTNDPSTSTSNYTRHYTDNHSSKIVFSNMSAWGPVAKSFVQAQAREYDMIGFTETHMSGLKFGGANEQTLIRIAASLRQVKDPWISMGGWNAKPSDWEATKWLTKVGGQLVAPSNGEVTCNRGRGSLINNVIAKVGLADPLMLRIVPEVPWRTHVGMCIHVKYGKMGWWNRTMITAKGLPTLPRPTTRPDQESKRQKKLQEAKMKRLERLEEHLQETYEELNREPSASVSSVAFAISTEHWKQ
ncbi:unnamed protein product, partial [Prorocentrum cordatum]